MHPSILSLLKKIQLCEDEEEENQIECFDSF